MRDSLQPPTVSPCKPYPPQMGPGVRKIGRRAFFRNSYEIRKWVSVHHFSPCYDPHNGRCRTWRPDFPFKLSNVMSDFKSKKIYRVGSTHEPVKED
jgi:hypothetical protein